MQMSPEVDSTWPSLAAGTKHEVGKVEVLVRDDTLVGG